MNEKRGTRSPKWRLLLLVPAAMLLAKTTRHHRAMWRPARGASEDGRGHGHHGRFGAREGAAGRGAFRLPPKIESMLDDWHTRAHQAAESMEPPII